GRLGTGVWKSATALGPVQRKFVDAVSGQAAYFGIIEESGERAVPTVRLKVDDRRITEAEWIIGRKGEWGPNGPGGNVLHVESLVADPPPDRGQTTDESLLREAMT